MGKLLFAAATLAATALASASALGDASCIDDKAKQSFACSGAPRELASGRKTGVDFHAIKPPGQATAVKPGTPKDDGVPPRDERTLRLQARQMKLLTTEVNRVETLYEGTKKNAPDRLQIARRLADGYVELESAAFREKTEAETRRDAAKKQNPPAAGAEQTKANEAERAMKISRKRAIDLYTMITTDYPNDAKVDEVLYYLAYEYEQAGDMKNARATYYDLIKKAPNSKYVPNAYLAFGELFFNEAQGDPTKWDLAAQAYEEVIKFQAPANRVQGYAYYKLAYVHWNKGEIPKALSSFKRTIEVGVGNPTLPGATRLADSARRDLIPVYALQGDPALAYGFLHGVSGDAQGSNDKTYRMMDDLGNAYIDTGHYPEGITLYRDLISRDRGGRVCGYQAHITEATMAMKSGNKDAIKSELEAQVRVAEKFKKESYDKDLAQACQSRTAALVAETAMAWHLEAVGSDNQRGTNDSKTMTLASQLYKRVIDGWTADEIASFEFPRLVKEDWPTRYKLEYAMADLLYAQKDWAKCGPAFDAVLQSDATGPDAAKAAYAAGLCYQNVYEGAHKGDLGHRSAGAATVRAQDAATRLAPREMKGAELAMVRAFDRYTCMIKPAASDVAGQEQLVEVEYARARTYFEAQHWDEAAYAFRAIAFAHADRDGGVYAAQLYLESANVLYKHFKKTSCLADMSSDVPKLVELHCAGDKATKNADACASLRVTQIDLMRLEGERLVAAGEFDRGGQVYFELFRRYCQDPVAAGQKPIAERCDEIGYDAAKAFQAARLLAKAIAVRRALIDFDERTHGNSALARKATWEVGANFQAIAVYDLAAQWFEKFAKLDPKAEHADSALSDAVLLRLGLGQVEEALKDAQDFQGRYGASKPAQAAGVAYALGAHYAEKEEWDKAKTALSGAMSVVDRAPPDIQLQAHATLGRALAKLGQSGPARAEYAKVRSGWSDPTAAEAKLRAAYPSEDTASVDRRLGRAVGAVGEAYFFAAEERRIAEVEPLKFPVYAGPGDKASVKAHVDTKVKDWYGKKMAAIQKVEPEYYKLLTLKPAPPPKWIIAAGSRAGLMWGDFVDDFRRAPIPKAWKGTILEQIYTNGIDQASERYKVEHARPALKKCLDLATEWHYFDAFSRGCEVWLAKNYKDEYHVVDELRGAPTLANSPLAERVPPLAYVATAGQRAR